MTLRKSISILFYIAIPVGLYFGVSFLMRYAEFVPPCFIFTVSHLLCPSCGGTRSLMALMRGDIGASLRYNAAVIFIAVLALLFYIEGFIFLAFKRKIKLAPRSNWFLFGVIGVFFFYFVIRNLV